MDFSDHPRNQAYKYSSVAFLQFCKQGNVALMFFMTLGGQVAPGGLSKYEGFLEMGVPLNYPFTDDVSILNHPILVIPIYGNPHMVNLDHGHQDLQ